MSKRNPYLTAERLLKNAGVALMFLIFIGYAVVMTVAGINSFGLPGLLVVPGFLAVLGVIALVAWGYVSLETVIRNRWYAARYRWERQNREESNVNG